MVSLDGLLVRIPKTTPCSLTRSITKQFQELVRELDLEIMELEPNHFNHFLALFHSHANYNSHPSLWTPHPPLIWFNSYVH